MYGKMKIVFHRLFWTLALFAGIIVPIIMYANATTGFEIESDRGAINSERDFRKTQQKISNNIENSLQMIA